MGKIATVFGTVVSMGAAYVAASFNNIMDFLQLIFAFVNAPLFATFLIGMFWKRATGNGAFIGLLSGTFCAALHHGLTLPAGASAGIKGGWLGLIHTYPSEMAQNFWAATFAWTGCFLVTIIVSLATKRLKTDEDLKGLVYSLTPKIKETGVPWYSQPATLGAIVLVAALILNIMFW
jgi:SSS family solute:Na+ symporter